MKNFKRLLSAALMLVMLLSFAGCHKKNEVAVTVGDVEFTSAYYMCALVNADSEAKTLVNESLEEDESSTDVDYFSKKVEGKDYVEWVEEKAMTTLKQVAAYKILCEENKLEPNEEDIANAEMYADYYWSNYGYSAYFEPNGVSKDTYTKYMTDSYFAETYFEFVYGKDGEKAIAADTIKTKMNENFIVADILNATYESDATDDDKTALKTKLDGYVTALNAGTKTFEQVYKEYNNVTDEEDTTTETTDTESEELKPQDKYASILGAEDTVYESEHYETVKAMATGEVKLIELEDKTGYVLAIKKDINADPYYLDTLDMTVRHLIADEEFEKTIEDYIKTLKVDVNSYAVKQFKVKKIKEPEYS